MTDYTALAATHYENFPVGSWVLRKRERRHLHRIYAFARTADDLADELRDARALAAFREALSVHLGEARPPEPTPLLHDLVVTIRECELPESLFFDLLDAFALDLEVTSHDRESLFAYCRKSADPVGRLVLRVFGHDDASLDALSDRICTGLQLVNHLQDVREDWRERRRVYLPREDLARFSVSVDELGGDSTPPGLRAVVRDWADTTRAMLREGWELPRRLHGRLAVELRAILRGAAAVLGQLHAIDYDVLATHVRLPRRTKVGVLLGAVFSRRMPAELHGLR
ncbi:MAG: squalene synthase HpnC [Planctomycetota bacterium]